MDVIRCDINKLTKFITIEWCDILVKDLDNPHGGLKVHLLLQLHPRD
jgi:hypothetical protein